MDNDNNMNDYNDNLEAVNKLGAGYFAALVFKVEKYKIINVKEIVTDIIGQLAGGKTLSQKQAGILMLFKSIFDPNRKP